MLSVRSSTCTVAFGSAGYISASVARGRRPRPPGSTRSRSGLLGYRSRSTGAELERVHKRRDDHGVGRCNGLVDQRDVLRGETHGRDQPDHSGRSGAGLGEGPRLDQASTPAISSPRRCSAMGAPPPGTPRRLLDRRRALPRSEPPPLRCLPRHGTGERGGSATTKAVLHHSLHQRTSHGGVDTGRVEQSLGQPQRSSHTFDAMEAAAW